MHCPHQRRSYGSTELHWYPFLIWFLKCNLLRLLEGKSFPLLTAAGVNTGENEWMGLRSWAQWFFSMFYFPVSFLCEKTNCPRSDSKYPGLGCLRINLTHLLYNSEKFASSHMTHTTTRSQQSFLRDCSCKSGPRGWELYSLLGAPGTIRDHRRRLSLGRPWPSVTEAKVSCLWLGCYRRAQGCCLELGKTESRT